MARLRVLNVGAGSDPRKHYVLLPEGDIEIINVDIVKRPWVHVVCDAHHLSEYFEEASFDAAILSHILEHVENPLKVLREVYKVVKYLVIVKIPNARYIMFGESPDHIYSWNEYTLRNLLNRAGFRKVIIRETTRFNKPSLVNKVKMVLLMRLTGHKSELTAYAWK